MKLLAKTLTLPVLLSLATPALALEYPIGEPQTMHGMEIAAVYLQPIEMEPAGMMRAAKDSDIHLEADVQATADNQNGYAEGDWLPHLAIDYKLTKKGSGEEISGHMMTMVANDGPHYGDNVKLFGPGEYKLELIIASGSEHFGRHVDKETGVAPWPGVFTAAYEFVFAGTGKKGSY